MRIPGSAVVLGIAVCLTASSTTARDPVTDAIDARITSPGIDLVAGEISIACSPIEINTLLVGHNSGPGGVDVLFWTSTDGGATWATNFTSVPEVTDPVAAISGSSQSASGRFFANFLRPDVQQVSLRQKDGVASAWGSTGAVSDVADLDKTFLWVDNSPHSPVPTHRYHVYCAWTQSLKAAEARTKAGA